MDIDELLKRLREKAQKEASRRNSAYDHYGWDNTPESAMPDEMQLCAALETLRAELERLTQRLEIDPRHNYDGIDCRDTTIRELEREKEDLRADVDRLKHENITITNKLDLLRSDSVMLVRKLRADNAALTDELHVTRTNLKDDISALLRKNTALRDELASALALNRRALQYLEGRDEKMGGMNANTQAGKLLADLRAADNQQKIHGGTNDKG